RTWRTLERITLCPWRIGAITTAALVLLHLQRPTR
ncbi:MAG: IS5/IS1182 family transposase, partial [Nocardioides sp.]